MKIAYVVALELREDNPSIAWLDLARRSLQLEFRGEPCNEGLLSYEATTSLKEPLISKVGLTPRIKNVPNIIKMNPSSSPYLLPLLQQIHHK